MKKVIEKIPIIFEIVLLIVGLILAGVVSGVLCLFGCDNDTGGAIARIMIGIILLAIFHKSFKFENSFKGVIPMLPVLLFALYKIPYHFISGGGDVNAITVSALLIGFAPAVFEEVLFRGIFISNLKKKYKKPITVLLISAVVFGLAHMTNIAGMDLLSVAIQVIVAMSLGIALGAIYLYTEDIVSLVIAHFLIDFLGVIFVGGESTPYFFLVIFVVLCCFEIVYGFWLVRKMKV